MRILSLDHTFQKSGMDIPMGTYVISDLQGYIGKEHI